MRSRMSAKDKLVKEVIRWEFDDISDLDPVAVTAAKSAKTVIGRLTWTLSVSAEQSGRTGLVPYLGIYLRCTYPEARRFWRCETRVNFKLVNRNDDAKSAKLPIRVTYFPDSHASGVGSQKIKRLSTKLWIQLSDDMDEVAVLSRRANTLASGVIPRKIDKMDDVTPEESDNESNSESDDSDKIEKKFERARIFKVKIKLENGKNGKKIKRMFRTSENYSHDNCDYCKELAESKPWCIGSSCNFAPALHEAFKFARLALNRFSFSGVRILVDFYLLETRFRDRLALSELEYLQMLREEDRPDIDNCWDWIIEMKPKILDICGEENRSMLTLEGMDKYTTAVQSPSLRLSSGHMGASLKSASEADAPKIFARIANLAGYSLNFGARNFMELVMARAHNPVGGQWKTGTWQAISLSAINAAIDPTWQGRVIGKDDEYANGDCNTYAIRDASGTTIILIDTTYVLAEQTEPVRGLWSKYNVCVEFHPEKTEEE